jgi:hypothetical protein
MPVPAQVDRVPRYDDEMSCTRGDFLLASRTDVLLARLERMDRSHLDFVIAAPGRAHTSDSGRARR